MLELNYIGVGEVEFCVRAANALLQARKTAGIFSKFHAKGVMQ